MFVPRGAAWSAAVGLAAILAMNCQDMPVEPDSAGPRANFSRQQTASGAIEDILATYASSWETGDCETLAALWAEDGLSLPPGPVAIAPTDYYAGCVAFFDVWGCSVMDFTISNTEIQRAGDLAFARGAYSFAYNCGADFCDSGKYLTVYVKEGKDWKMLRDVYDYWECD